MPSSYPRRTVLLFLDWDSTLTKASTVPLIASLATFPKPHACYDTLSEAYFNDLKAHDQEYQPVENDRRFIYPEFNYLKSLERVETASLKRIENAGVFSGVTLSHIHRAADESIRHGKVALRESWQELTSRRSYPQTLPPEKEVHIISVAWSALFIRLCLESAGWSPNSPDGAEEWALESVHANEIDGNGKGCVQGDRYGDGRFIVTAGDKYAVMRKIIVDYKAKRPDVIPKTVYIGDSVTDLICMIEADVGICMVDLPMSAEQDRLQQTLSRIGVQTKHITQYKGYSAELLNRDKTLWLTSDFDDIVESGAIS